MGGFNGSGTYQRYYNWTQDAANSIDITASRVDTEDTGFATGLSLCVTRDGQGAMTADFLPAAANANALGSAVLPWTQILTTAFQSTKTGTQAWGPVAAALVDATPDKGPFTATLTGPFSATGTLKFERQGTHVALYCDTAILGTASLSAVINISGLPASLIPSGAGRVVPCGGLENNSIGNLMGLFTVFNTGAITIALSLVSGSTITTQNSFTNTGTCGIQAGWSVTYPL